MNIYVHTFKINKTRNASVLLLKHVNSHFFYFARHLLLFLFLSAIDDKERTYAVFN